MKSTFEEVLTKDGYLVYTTRGRSMEPLLRQNRDLVILRPKAARLKKYDKERRSALSVNDRHTKDGNYDSYRSSVSRGNGLAHEMNLGTIDSLSLTKNIAQFRRNFNTFRNKYRIDYSARNRTITDTDIAANLSNYRTVPEYIQKDMTQQRMEAGSGRTARTALRFPSGTVRRDSMRIEYSEIVGATGTADVTIEAPGCGGAR